MKKIKLEEFIPDSNNANKGTERGRGMLENSLSKYGLGRSILVDKNNVAIAGNKTLETAVESGFENAIVIETTGEDLVVVKRTDLDLETDEKAKLLAIADNRVGELSLSWDTDVLKELDVEIGLADFFSEDEFNGLLNIEAEPLEEDKTPLGEQPKRDMQPGDIKKIGEAIAICMHQEDGTAIKILLDMIGIDTTEINLPTWGEYSKELIHRF